ncbi:Fusaric acid resistance protein-like [Pseudidiomarina planktonica]|uniref:Fusaric acid resistance protein-like n=1 Tax=Pseudidiomarina planktonica TaxID=1323738 RepID=A0A1Y6G015_9GAMM|nr:FUSC family protein [Pseudidiomarina planktonica]SMQ79874.1 Fusaric acid resistance protein-like [Pseudidiomarina planktonica]
MRLKQRIRIELHYLLTFHSTDRLWQMPVAAALAIGLPLLVGVYFGRLDYGLVSSLGGLVFLYVPETPLYHRMLKLMACAFGMTACYTLGLISQFFPVFMVPSLIFISVLATMVSRFYGLGPPGSLFFITAAGIAAYTPMDGRSVPLMIGLFSMGTILACAIAFFYSVNVLRIRAPHRVLPWPRPTFGFVVFDAVVIGFFIGLSLAVAQLLQLEKPYWVPLSCLAVIQGASVRDIWDKQLHRVLGTAIGMLLAWFLLEQPLNQWSIALVMMLLAFLIEFMVVRHYVVAAIFFTPLTILIAEAASLGETSVDTLIEARFYDTLLGCLFGLLGGICIHSKRFRLKAGKQLRRIIPNRWLNNLAADEAEIEDLSASKHKAKTTPDNK